MFGMGFAPSKGKTKLQNWVCSRLNLVFAGGELDEVDGFSYLSSYLTLWSDVGRNVLAYINDLTCTNLRHI